MAEDKLRFICEACNYKFERIKSWKERICPYCGKRSVHEERSVADLLDDSELGTCVDL